MTTKQLPDRALGPRRSPRASPFLTCLDTEDAFRPGNTPDPGEISYAQRHADAGVPIDVLAELLDHRNLNITRGYYRVGEDRRRAAVDTVTAMSFDRHGNRIWRAAEALLDAEHARYALVLQR